MAKSDLAKLALTALILAYNTSQVQASEPEEKTTDGMFLAVAACGGHGCGGKRNEISDATTETDPYNARTNTYQSGRSATPGTTSYGTYGSYGAGSSTYSSPSSSSTYSSPSYGSSGYSTSERSYGSDWNTDANRGASVEYGRPSYGSSWTTDSSYTTPGAYGSSVTIIMTDEEFANQLDRDTKPIFWRLTKENRERAKSLAQQPNYSDKNEAVKEIQRQTEGRSNATGRTATSNGMFNR